MEGYDGEDVDDHADHAGNGYCTRKISDRILKTSILKLYKELMYVPSFLL